MELKEVEADGSDVRLEYVNIPCKKSKLYLWSGMTPALDAVETIY